MARLEVDLVRKGGRCMGMGEQNENLPIRCEHRHGVIHKILVVESVDPVGGDDVCLDRITS